MLSLLLRICQGIVAVAAGVVLLTGCSQTGIQSNVNHGAIEGTVRDNYTDRPIAGAMVTVGANTATTGASGEFRLQSVPEGLNTIEVRKDSYERFRTSVLVGPRTEFHAFLDLIGRFAHLKGRVFLGRSQIAMPNVLVSIEPMATRTDSAGHFQFDSLNPGHYTLRARLNNHVMFEEAIVVKGETNHDIRMADTRMSGCVSHVVDGPLAGVEVELAGLTAVTDEDGSFWFPHAPQGRHLVRFRHPNYLPTERFQTLDAQPALLDMRLQRHMVDTVVVTGDATVMWGNFGLCPSCPDWGSPGDNYGLSPTLLLGHYLAPDPLAPGSAWNGVARSVIALPGMPEHIELDEFQSARLELHPAAQPFDGAVITLRRARQAFPWTETLMTWQTLPETYVIPIAWHSLTDLTPLAIDMTSYFAEGPGPPPSLVLQTDESGFATTPRTTSFHSRQSESLKKRPGIIFEYIR